MTAAAHRAVAGFTDHYGDSPVLTWAAPGRVNLIGEHTDYNDGFVLPFALPHRTAVAAAPLDRLEWTVWSEFGGASVTFGAAELSPGRVDGWGAYVAGVIWVLREAGIEVPGARLAIASDVPVGAGLSSSAALECAVLAAVLDLAGALDDVPRSQWPTLAQRAENAYVGVPCGIMDQSAAVHCQADHVLFLDCRTHDADNVPFHQDGSTILVIDTRAPHRHAGGEYAARRSTCEAAARHLGVAALRDVTDLDQALAALPDDISRRRVRHVVTENARVMATVELLRAGRSLDVGALLTASHASLRDDYEVTVPELDVAVEAALEAGAYGARMTGGGFGGCAIALVDRDAVDRVADAVRDAFASRGFADPRTFTAAPAAGVARVL